MALLLIDGPAVLPDVAAVCDVVADVVGQGSAGLCGEAVIAGSITPSRRRASSATRRASIRSAARLSIVPVDRSMRRPSCVYHWAIHAPPGFRRKSVPWPLPRRLLIRFSCCLPTAITNVQPGSAHRRLVRRSEVAYHKGEGNTKSITRRPHPSPVRCNRATPQIGGRMPVSSGRGCPRTKRAGLPRRSSRLTR